MQKCDPRIEKKITQSRLVSNATRYIIQCKFLMKINVILTTTKKINCMH